MIDDLLHVCFRGTFEKLEVAVRVCVCVCCWVLAPRAVAPPVIVSCDGPFDRTWWTKAMQPLRS